MRSTRRDILVPIVSLASCIAAAGEPAAHPKTPVPDAEAQQTAKKAAGELFADRFQQAKTTAEKTALATDMMDAAAKVQAGSADQYVLLKIARDVAAGTGDAATALQAAERLLEQFDEPAAELIGDTLLTAARESTTSAQYKAVAEAALSFAGQLADADQYETALRVCEAARSSAQRAKLYPLAKELTGQIEEIKRQQLLSDEYRKALGVLEDKPTDPEANLAAGRHLCFVKGDWKRGVPMLALGSDAPLKAAAINDLRGANSADEQAAIGDAWWDLAEAKQGEERETLRLRAGFWYRQAEPKLAVGLAGLKITQRLEELKKVDRELPTASQAATATQAPALAIAPFAERAATQYQMLWAKHLRIPIVQTNSIGMRFVLIPPGEFDMGSFGSDANEAPKHRVRISKPFYLGVCEVTQEEYQRIAGHNPSKFQGEPRRPVEQVDWNEATEFCRRLNELPHERTTGVKYRLPTEAEWEYAARAGTTTCYSFGDAPQMLSANAWWRENSQGQTGPVGQLRPNAWGLCDMHGNVWEWCQDRYARDYYAKSPPCDPLGASEGSDRVVRGGCWSGRADGVRLAIRAGNTPSLRNGFMGFRVACSPAGQ